MPLGVKPECSLCKSNTSSMWNKAENGEIHCNECLTKQTHLGKEENGNGVIQSKKGLGLSENVQERVLRKSSRNKPSRYRVASSKPIATKGKGRRIIFKKSQPVRAPTAISTVVTGNSIHYDGIFWQIGDIVSLVDEDSNVYYAQIRGFLQDQYYEKSAVITWLLPTQGSSVMKFDPSTYILGPEEDLPRKMDHMEFVCHAPSDYFKSNKTPYPYMDNNPDLCYVWSSFGPEIKVTPKMDDIYGPGNDGSSSATSVSGMKKTKLDKMKIKEEKRLIVVE